MGDDPGCVLENRRRLAAAFGAAPGDFVFARQVHGAGVRVVAEADRGSGAFRARRRRSGRRAADALVTTSPGVVLAILTADCVPIVLHDPVAGVLACVHAGWRGTVAGVTAAALAAMQGLGTRPSDVVAGIGPAVGADRYQVGPDVHEAVDPVLRPGRGAGSSAPTRRPRPLAARPALPPTATPSARPASPAARIHADRHAPPAPARASSSVDRDRAPLRPARPGRPGCGPAVSDERAARTVFRYRDYAVDAERGLLTCRYELDGREFTERVTLGPRRAVAHRQARAAARLVFLLAGVSYYKTAAPPGHRPRRDRA